MQAATKRDEHRPLIRWGWRRIASRIVAPLALAAVLWLTFGPNPTIQVGPATTRITAPLGPDGLPDYRRALLDALQNDIARDDNAAAPLLMAFWPHGEDSAMLSKSQAQRLAKELGVASPPLATQSFTSRDAPDFRDGIARMLAERLDRPEWKHATEDDTDKESLRRSDIDYVRWGVCDPVGRPWTAHDLPFMAEWIEKNAGAYDELINASHRSTWFFPKIGRLGDESKTLGPSLAESYLIRSAVQNLISRCNYHRGEGGYEPAATDALAVLRLCQLAEKAPFNTTRMVGFGMEKLVMGLLKEIAQDPMTTPAALRLLSDGLRSLGPPPSFADAMDVGERYATLETFILASRDGLGAVGQRIEREHQELGVSMEILKDGSLREQRWVFLSPTVHAMAKQLTVDWNVVLRQVNETIDEVTDAMRLPAKQRRNALLLLDAKNDARGAKGWTSGSLANAMTPAGRGRLIADAWAAQHAVQGGMLSSMADDAAFQRRLIEIKLALALYRAENGAYPDTIADLPPGSLSTPFEELLDGSVIEDELEYVRSANGYHLRNVSAGVTEDLIDGESPVREPEPWPWAPGGELFERAAE